MGCTASKQQATTVVVTAPVLGQSRDAGKKTIKNVGTSFCSAVPPANSVEQRPRDGNKHSDTEESVKSFGLHDDNAIPESAASSPGGEIRELGSINHMHTSQSMPKLDHNGHPKLLKHSSSVIGLDAMIEERKEAGGLTTNVVRIEVPFGKPIEEVYNGVHDGKILGSGISGLVRLVSHKATGVKYAVKCLDLGLIDSDEGLEQLREEIFIMCQLDHPNIVRLEEVYESHNEIYLVQELCTGGELFDRLDEQPDYHYTEQQCARLVKQMLSAVRYIHSKGIVHRDLKLENFLFSSSAVDSELKMIDFGLSKHFDHGQVHHEAVGTPYTVAPEVIKGRYGEKCDIWAIGVITYLLLSGDPPFGGCGGPEPLSVVRMNILAGKFKFEPAETWANVSKAAKDFISSLLITDPEKRPSAAQAKESKWMVEWANKEFLANGSNALNPNVVKALVGFKEYTDMRKLLCEVLSFTLLPSQIRDLKKEFEKIDIEGRGEITFEALKSVLMKNAGTGSLGSLTEEEVEDIFNAMRVRKTDQTIHWHEFIAAGLSQCDVDDRNLRLAFDRLDSHHKGYITFDDVLDLMGASDGESEAAIMAMFQDSLQLCRSKHARITYDDFLLLMKGQTYEDAGLLNHNQAPVMHSPIVSYRRTKKGLTPPDMFILDGTGPNAMPIMPSLGGSSLTLMPSIPSLTSGLMAPSRKTASLTDLTAADGVSLPVVAEEPRAETEAEAATILESVTHMSFDIPKVPLLPSFDMQYQDQGPLSFDAQDTPPSSTPPIPSTPVQASSLTELSMSPSAIPKQALPQRMNRNRSRSYDSSDVATPDSPLTPRPTLPAASAKPLNSPSDSRRSILLPEHLHHVPGDKSILKGMVSDSDVLTNPSKKTMLVVNRELYRVHRRMRLAVLEASKRFEEKQIMRECLNMDQKGHAKKAEEGVAAGLVMRHGAQTRQDSTGAQTMREMLRQREKEREEQLAAATRKAGRRSRRNKTVSDMSAMMTAVGCGSPSSSSPIQHSGSTDMCDCERNLALNAQTWTGPAPDFESTNLGTPRDNFQKFYSQPVVTIHEHQSLSNQQP